MHKQFRNFGTPLSHVVEECGEVIAAAGKVLRFGWDSTNPLLPIADQVVNETLMKQEVADLECAISRLKNERGW